MVTASGKVKISSKPARIRAWIKALRSGKYKQGVGELHNDGRFCCLGVLCDLYRKSTKDGYWTEDGFVYGYESVAAYGLPPIVQAWAGVTNENPSICTDAALTAVDANDSLEMTFDQIADKLEAELDAET